MKYISNANISAFAIMILILTVYGLHEGFKLIKDISFAINLPKIAFSGFIAFALAGIIMRLAAKAGFWFGVKGGALLYAVMLIVIGFLLF